MLFYWKFWFCSFFVKQTHKIFHIKLDDFRHDAGKFGRICLSQYHPSSGKYVDTWSVRNFLALPVLQTNITHYIQFNLNTKCSSQQQQQIVDENINIEYSVDFGKHWYLLLNPCVTDTICSRDVQHVYSAKITLPSS